MRLWATGRVEVLEEYDDRLIRTVSLVFQMPSVIRFVRGLAGRRRHRVCFSKRNVFARDKGRCQYCGRALSLREATFDHVVPRSHGGKTRWDNVVIACLRCNQRKAARTPSQAHMRLRAQPIEPRTLPGRFGNGLRYCGQMPEAWEPYLGA